MGDGDDVHKPEQRKFLGIHWPDDIYAKPIEKKDEHFLEDDVKIRGILRPREEGCPAGCSEIWVSRDKAVHEKTKLYNSQTAIVF